MLKYLQYQVIYLPLWCCRYVQHYITPFFFLIYLNLTNTAFVDYKNYAYFISDARDTAGNTLTVYSEFAPLRRSCYFHFRTV